MEPDRNNCIDKLILGGIRSGKSDYGESLALNKYQRVVLENSKHADSVASLLICLVFLDEKKQDPSMQSRIQKHRSKRNKAFQVVTLCDNCAIVDQIRAQLNPKKTKNFFEDKSKRKKTLCVLLDSFDAFLSDLLLNAEQQNKRKLESETEQQLHAESQQFVKKLNDMLCFCREKNIELYLVVVSVEVGMSLVSQYKVGSLFQDALGSGNQKLAAVSKNVDLVVAGIPVKVK